MNNSTIVILGGGPAGMSAALFLAQKGIKSTIIERKKYPRDKICGDAISGKVISTLKHLYPDILQHFKHFDKTANCWGITFIAPNTTKAEIPFKLDFEQNKEILPSGFVIKRIDFDYFLYQKCVENTLIEFKENTDYKDINKITEGWEIRLNSGEIIQSHLILCADGAQSKFAKQFGGMQLEHEHYSGSIRAYYKNVKGFNEGNFLELYFLKGLLPGYFWIFPLPNGEANIGLGLRSDYISKHKVNLKEVFHSIVTTTLKERFQGAELMGKLEGFGIPLGSKKRNISGDHFMLLGDAASLVDPFTGEGISNALLSGKLAAEIAEKAALSTHYTKEYLKQYDTLVYAKVGQELQLSTWLQILSRYPWLMNFIIKKANKNKEFRETITSMFDNVDLRKKFRDPRFYFKILFR